jgi:SAM-dependent methyltransferase
MTIRHSAARFANSILGPTFTRHYVRTLRTRGPRAAYEAKEAWTSRYEAAVAEGDFNDATTLVRGARPVVVRYHYNAVENAILEESLDKRFPVRPAVLDIGSGAGHWIDFYRDVLDAREVVGVEISSSAAEALARKYEHDSDVTIVERDVSEEGFDLERRFDLVNAVGVLFHIVVDNAWQRAVRNLGAHLAPGGRMLVAEHVGLVTHDVDFRRPEPDGGHSKDAVYVTKRVRSAYQWRQCARRADIRVLRMQRIQKHRAIRTPANRLIVLEGKAAPPPAEPRP